MQNTVTVGNTEYLISEMSAFDQFHVARRIAPLLGGGLESLNGSFDRILDIFGGSFDLDSEIDLKKGFELLTLTGPKILEALSKLSDENSEYVIRKCLSVVQRQQAKGWARVMNSNGNLMFQDIGLKDMLMLTAHVIKDNLSDFFPTSQPDSAEAK